LRQSDEELGDAVN